ncbi:hypothetical protein TYRP_008702 [Tyrophagus putrescentiae]|nr:hypothetical protein TYRP_008702 [Tyrophagus putrescentiae]
MKPPCRSGWPYSSCSMVSSIVSRRTALPRLTSSRPEARMRTKVLNGWGPESSPKGSAKSSGDSCSRTPAMNWSVCWRYTAGRKRYRRTMAKVSEGGSTAVEVGLVVAEGLQSFVKGLVHLSAAGALHRLVQLDGPLQLADLLHVERYNFDNVLSGGGAAVVHLLLLR